jgi:hypothetical protein
MLVIQQIKLGYIRLCQAQGKSLCLQQIDKASIQLNHQLSLLRLLLMLRLLLWQHYRQSKD